MGENNRSTDDFSTPASNVNNDSVNNLSVKNVHNNEIDSTDAIECSSKYDSCNVDKRDNGGEKRQSCETKLNSPEHKTDRV